MTPAAWIGLGLGAAVAGLVGSLFWRWRAKQPRWRNLGSLRLPQASYAGYENGPVANVGRLQLALEKAVDCLGQVWPLELVVGATRGVRILVMPTPEWVDAWGRSVAGTSGRGILCVGSDFLALGHELAHHLEEALDGRRDDGHEGWNGRGIRRAEGEFETWLRAQR